METLSRQLMELECLAAMYPDDAPATAAGAEIAMTRSDVDANADARTLLDAWDDGAGETPSDDALAALPRPRATLTIPVRRARRRDGDGDGVDDDRFDGGVVVLRATLPSEYPRACSLLFSHTFGRLNPIFFFSKGSVPLGGRAASPSSSSSSSSVPRGRPSMTK